MSSLQRSMRQPSSGDESARGRGAMLVLFALIASLSAAATVSAQPMPTCRSDIPLVLQPSTCLPDPHAGKLAQQTATASLASQRPAKKTLADLLRERDGNDPRPRAGAERRPDGANLIKGRALVH